MSEIYQGNVPHFLNAVISSKVGSINRGSLWVVVFENLGAISSTIDTALAWENQEWKIEAARNAVLGTEFQEANGCVFCSSIDLPGDSLVVNPGGNIQSNAFIRSYVGEGRNQFPELRMTFLDTNVSFVDNFLRPWSIATGTFGLWKGSTTYPYRTTAHCYKLGAFKGTNSTEVNNSDAPGIVMKMTFEDICCIGVSNTEQNYAPVTSPVAREAQFIYNYYRIDSTTGNPFVG
jgi:hypothetical protein